MFVDQKGVLRSSLLIPINRRASWLMGFRFIGFDLFFIFVIIIIILLKNLCFFLGDWRAENSDFFITEGAVQNDSILLKNTTQAKLKKKKLLLYEMSGKYNIIFLRMPTNMFTF